ncbi:MAG: MBL fold metallo-hydrolase [Chloroflexota bacterium]|nr:MBL fold metallo-hydrolase [Chloroflexota bacterium]
MAETQTIALEPVDTVEITTLVDNTVDHLLPASGQARRASLGGVPGGPSVETPLLAEPRIADALVAEHGFSALVQVSRGGRTHRLLFDTGLSPGGVAHNMDVLGVRLADVEAIVMSHGHIDHTGGLHGLAARNGRRLPMLLHPDFWLERRIAPPDMEPLELPTVSRGALAGAGFEVIEGARPSLLLDGSVLITGEVARSTAFERGFPVHQAKRDGAWTPDPLILDDQALVADVRGRGLVVLTGCGHAGIVNIVRHAQRLTGESRIAAIVGGFHLSGPLFDPIIPATVEALAGFAPELVVPAHCSGFAAMRAISLALPDAFVQSSTGTRYIVGAGRE